MVVQSFPIKIDEAQAKAMSMKRLSLLGRLLIRKAPAVEMKTIFIENKIITMQITNVPPPFIRWFRKSKEPVRSKMQIIANGSTSSVSLYDGTGLEIVDMEVDDEKIQLSDYPDHQLLTRGRSLARQILRRRVGGNVSIEPLSIQSVFRPYHVAFFGTLREGSKVRYMPIPADSNIVRKTF